MRLFWWFSSTVFLLISFWAKKSSCAANLKQLTGGVVAEEEGKRKILCGIKRGLAKVCTFWSLISVGPHKRPPPIAFYREAHIWRVLPTYRAGDAIGLTHTVLQATATEIKVKADTFSPSCFPSSCWSKLLKKLLFRFIIDVSLQTSWKLDYTFFL